VDCWKAPVWQWQTGSRVPKDWERCRVRGGSSQWILNSIREFQQACLVLDIRRLHISKLCLLNSCADYSFVLDQFEHGGSERMHLAGFSEILAMVSLRYEDIYPQFSSVQRRHFRRSSLLEFVVGIGNLMDCLKGIMVRFRES
jgi:hypothetical protein